MRNISLEVPPGHRLVRVADDPSLWRPVNTMCSGLWPEFMLHDPVADRCWGRLFADWPSFQLALLDDEREVVAASQAAPLCWDGTDAGLPGGWDAQLERSVADLEARRTPDTLGAIQIAVARRRRGEGLSGVMLSAMRALASMSGLTALIACVRPTDKVRYPLMPIEVYAAWRRDDGLPFDPWLRVHARAGARIVRAAPRSMTITGSVGEWEAWTRLSFPVSGPYIVDRALAPVEIDLDGDVGTYLDPNVWMVHELGR